MIEYGQTGTRIAIPEVDDIIASGRLSKTRRRWRIPKYTLRQALGIMVLFALGMGYLQHPIRALIRSFSLESFLRPFSFYYWIFGWEWSSPVAEPHWWSVAIGAVVFFAVYLLQLFCVYWVARWSFNKNSAAEITTMAAFLLGICIGLYFLTTLLAVPAAPVCSPC